MSARPSHAQRELGPASDLAGSSYFIAFATGLIAVFGFLLLIRMPRRCLPADAMHGLCACEPADLAAGNCEPPRPPMTNAIEIIPVMAEPKLGSRKASDVPNAWARKPQPAAPKTPDSPLPSPHAEKTADAIPKSHVADAAAPVVENVVDASTPVVETPVDAGVASADPSPATTDASTPNTPTAGDPTGTPEGRAQARVCGGYYGALGPWFSSRTNYRGIPWDQLKTLRAAAFVTVQDRKVVSASMTAPSGNAAFDARVSAALSSTVGQLVPKRPDFCPEKPFPVTFSCTNEQACSDPL